MVHHRVRGGRLFAVMDDGVRTETFKNAFDNAIVAQVTDEKFDLAIRSLVPRFHSVMQGVNRYQRLDI